MKPAVPRTSVAPDFTKFSGVTAMIPRFLLLPAVCLLGGCALITSGRHQTVAIDTDPAVPAHCTLSNRKGVWTVVATPGSTKVTQARGPLRVTCAAENGARGEVFIDSGMAYATLGNFLIGGPVGSIIDMTSGAAYRYPDTVTVPLAGDHPATPPAKRPPERPTPPPGDLLPAVPDIEPST